MYSQSAKALRQMRMKVGTWGQRENQAHNVLCYLKQRKLRDITPINIRGEAYANLMYM